VGVTAQILWYAMFRAGPVVRRTHSHLLNGGRPTTSPKFLQLSYVLPGGARMVYILLLKCKLSYTQRNIHRFIHTYFHRNGIITASYKTQERIHIFSLVQVSSKNTTYVQESVGCLHTGNVGM
jgi:hypothetical protein